MTTMTNNTNYRRTLSASSITGDTVKNAQGENLGNVKDVMLDLDTGRIAYVVLSYGGVMGMGDKLFAVPWGAFSVDENDKKLILNVDQETLKNAEGFEKSNWPDTADPAWGERIHQHYGVSPYWEER